MMIKEIRHFKADEIRMESDEDLPTLTGYITKFEDRSQLLNDKDGMFYEFIDKRAFDKTLKERENITALFNHNFDSVLGSTQNDSLQLEVDDVGLRFTLKPNMEVSYIADIVNLVKGGEVRGCSFGFRARDDQWDSSNEVRERTLTDIDLYEVTLTPFPVYESSVVDYRSYNKVIEQEEKQKQNEVRKRKLMIEANL